MLSLIGIVGAGPAGSYMFYLLAKSGFKVALHEQYRVGERVVCGELVPKPCEIEDLVANKAPLYEVSNLISSLDVRVCETEEMEVYLDEKFWVSFRFQGYVIDKPRLLKKLVQMGIDEGGKLFEKSRFYGLHEYKQDALKASFSNQVESYELLVGADGFPSSVAKAASLRSGYSMSDWALCVNQRFSNVKLDEGVVKIFFSRDLAPGGFAWLIPRGDEVVNVGLGVRMEQVKRGVNVLASLKKFLAKLRELEDSKPLTLPQLKPIPVGGYVMNFASDKVVLIGDAAGTVVPVDGAGIIPSMLSSQAAFNSIVLRQADLKSTLSNYIGSMIDNGLAYRKLGEKLVYNKLGSALVKALATPSLVEKILKAKETWALLLAKIF